MSPWQPDFGDGSPTAKMAADHSSTEPPIQKTGDNGAGSLRLPSMCNLAALSLPNSSGARVYPNQAPRTCTKTPI